MVNRLTAQGTKNERGLIFYFLYSRLLGEEKRIREFYQSRGLDRVTQPSGEGMLLGSRRVR